MLYLEDYPIGTVWQAGPYDVTRDEVLDFASKYDPQPFHLDDAAAAETHFGRISASGWHTCAMMMRMLVEYWQASETAGLGSPGIDEIRWLKPVYPDDRLRLLGEVVECRPSRSKPAIGSLHSRLSVINQHDVTVMTMIAITLMPRKGQTT